MLLAYIKKALGFQSIVAFGFASTLALLSFASIVPAGSWGAQTLGQANYPLWGLTVSALLAMAWVGLQAVQRRVVQTATPNQLPTLEKLALLSNAVGLLMVSLSYWVLQGPLALLLLLPFSVLQAQLFGHQKAAKVFAGVVLAVVLTGFAWGCPNLALLSVPLTLISLLPLAVVSFYYGELVGFAIRNIRQQLQHWQGLASTDALTGLINRRQFNAHLTAEMARARRHHTSLALALFDIDNFKKLNDFYGHPTGDRILNELGSLMASNIRESDVAARYGGEEFALILPETRRLEAYELLERIRRMVERHVFCLPDNPITLSISVGVTQLDNEGHSAFSFVQEADSALYEAKNNGKNRVILYGMGTTAPSLLSDSFQLPFHGPASVKAKQDRVS